MCLGGSLKWQHQQNCTKIHTDTIFSWYANYVFSKFLNLHEPDYIWVHKNDRPRMIENFWVITWFEFTSNYDGWKSEPKTLNLFQVTLRLTSGCWHLTFLEYFFTRFSSINPHAPDQFTPSRARCAKNCGLALTHR